MNEGNEQDELTALREENDLLKRQILMYQKQYKRSWVMFHISLVMLAILIMGR